MHGFIGVITMCNESKRNALSQQAAARKRALFGLLRLCSEPFRAQKRLQNASKGRDFDAKSLGLR